MMNESLRSIPSVDRILRDLGETDLPRPAVLAVVRRELAAARERLSQPPTSDYQAQTTDLLRSIRSALDDLRRSRIQPVINGTGILIHTNFGRSPLGPSVIGSLTEIAANYSNLEYDLTGGVRGGRAAYLEHNLALLCEAEAATVVNNCAAALVLALRHFASRPPRVEVVISRGELVQIGGGFRIPEILEASGAALREVGTTNKTTADDYRRALCPQTAMVLKVHRSNFYMGGFVESPPSEQLAAMAREANVPFVEDLGSGATFPTEALASDPAKAEHEPTPAEVLRQGADLVCFSGDKLLGGPQAGILAGRSDLVAALKQDPFFRALRCDKLILTALQTTVDLHLRVGSGEIPDPSSGIPILEMMRTPVETLRHRAEAIVASLDGLPLKASAGTAESQIGGGSLPRTTIPSVTVDIEPQSMTPNDLAARLRAGKPPVIGYVAEGRFKLDLRTIFPRQDAELVASIGGGV
jgi:L-seryl-tRNA(Ser) seleniumtransferase